VPASLLPVVAALELKVIPARFAEDEFGPLPASPLSTAPPGSATATTTASTAELTQEQPLVVPHDEQAKQLPARCIWMPHWKQ
jgi:hypothetical protein